MAAEIKIEGRGAAQILTFIRSDHANALTMDMATQFFNALKHATTDRATRAVMIKGDGGNFMDDYDMTRFGGDYNAALEYATQLMQPYHSAIREMQVMDKPVLAVINGKCTGPGLSLMLASDLVLAGQNAKFNCGFTNKAMTPDGACSFFLPRKAGAMKAIELLMLNETFGSTEAEKWNLVNAVIEDDKLQEVALAWLDRLSNGPTRAYGGIKKLMLKAFEQDLNQHLSLEHTYWGASARSFDFREFLRAQQAKRPTKFTGT